MLLRLPSPIRIPLAWFAFAANTVLHCVPLFLIAVIKLVLRFAAAQRICRRFLTGIGESWIAVNARLLGLFTRIHWRVDGLEGLLREEWYLVLANHQSWVDIGVLQTVLNRRVPFLTFFLKSQLIWVPLLGLAWWALDFPFMKRYSKAELERRPELRGTDLEATRRACAKFRRLPVSVMNFVEGTRFTAAKHAEQGAGFRHLLRPKAGGVGFVLGAMGDILHAVLDVTIAYPGGRPTFADLVAGRVAEIRVAIRTLPLAADLLGGEYETDAAYRERVQAWLNGLWTEKDATMARLLAP